MGMIQDGATYVNAHTSLELCSATSCDGCAPLRVDIAFKMAARQTNKSLHDGTWYPTRVGEEEEWKEGHCETVQPNEA